MALHRDFPQSPHAILDPGIHANSSVRLSGLDGTETSG
jgi:hypothetical protein